MSATFEVGGVVVANGFGPGRITGIEEEEIYGATIWMYSLDSFHYNTQLRCPKNNLRTIATTEELEKALVELKHDRKHRKRLGKGYWDEMAALRRENTLVATAKLIRESTLVGSSNGERPLFLSEVAVIRECSLDDAAMYLQSETQGKYMFFVGEAEAAVHHLETAHERPTGARPIRDGFIDPASIGSDETNPPFQGPPAPHNLPKVHEDNVVKPQAATPEPKKKRVTQPRAKPKEVPPKKGEPKKVFKGIVRRPDGAWGPVYE